jgi:GNAT superfamily N-acetyltransferase
MLRHWGSDGVADPDFHDDLDAAIRLWDDPVASPAAPVSGLSDLIAAVRAGAPAVVAVVGDDLIGTAVAAVHGGRASVQRISLALSWRQRGIGSAMLTELERRLVSVGVHRIDCLLADAGEVGAAALEHSGYSVRKHMSSTRSSNRSHSGLASSRLMPSRPANGMTSSRSVDIAPVSQTSDSGEGSTVPIWTTGNACRGNADLR